MTDPYVIVGLARTRRPWFSEMSRWATSGSAPIEFVRCLTVEEARAVLGSGRQLSAVVADGSTRGLDRDLIATAAAAGVPTFVVDDGRTHRDWDSLGCAAVLPAVMEPSDLSGALARHSRPVERSGTRGPTRAAIEDEAPRSRVVSVTGSGGTGATTVAMCLAQSFGSDDRSGSVALVDGCRIADHAMYHDVGDVIPGLPELVDAHRLDHPDPDAIRSLLFDVDPRGYEVLLGMRGPRDWVAMRPSSLGAALDGLERSYDLVVVDHDPDLEGEDATGSNDVEERHGIARAAVRRADVVVAVGTASVHGLHGLGRLTRTLLDHGVPAERLLPVVGRAPRSPARRAAITRVLNDVRGGEPALHPPLFLGTNRSLESAHRGATRLPESLCRPLGRAARRLLLETGPRRRSSDDAPRAIRAGELGTRVDDVRPTGQGQHRSDAA